MVYTITCNPSLDYGVTVENFQMGHTNRTVTEQMNVGGKGINVSIVLKHLGIPTKILGFTAGFTGREIEKRIKEQEIEAEWIRLRREIPALMSNYFLTKERRLTDKVLTFLKKRCRS